MGLKEVCSYWGRFDLKKPIRSLTEDLVIERKKQMLEELKQMEERLKRHVTECKREVIKEFLGLNKAKATENKKEQKNGFKI